MLVVLTIYGVSWDTFFLPISAALIAFSFALSAMLQRLIDSFTFTLIMTPFDVGDKVVITTLTPTTLPVIGILTVTRVAFYTTEFSDVNNKFVVLRNSDIIDCAM